MSQWNPNLEKEYPTFYRTVEHLQKKANFFKNSLPKLFDSKYNYELAERVCKTALQVSSNQWNEYLRNVDSLIGLSLDFLKLQVQLEKTGRYQYSSFKEVQDNAYSKEEGDGPNYLWGLYFSEMFWKIHHNFTNFFLKEFVSQEKKIGNVLEIPSGTAFFLSEFLRNNPDWNGIGIDLAAVSIDISRQILRANGIPDIRYQIVQKDFFEYETEKRFDRIICGEFLEHLENPLTILQKFNKILKSEGKLFLTVAVWAAGIDHIYLYSHPEEVRQHIQEAGFKIEKELVQAVFEKDEKNPEKGKIPVSYTAILSKK